MPRATPISPPEEHGQERKRILNVIAQRKYRQRKREKYAALEAQAKSPTGSADASTSPDESSASSASLEETAASTHNASGVSLPELQKTRYSDPIVEATANAFDLDALLISPSDLDVSDDSFHFSNDLLPEQLYPYLETEPVISMDMAMDVPMMKLMKVAAYSAQMLGCDDILWDPMASWIPQPHGFAMLPPHMQPTSAQLTIPHHPLFDILPWPQLRSKMIYFFSLPQQCRPPVARDPMAIANLAFDIDDEAEGFRVNGDGFSDQWEIGNAFFQKWWWAVDQKIIEESNGFRTQRGQKKLTFPVN